MTVTASVAPSAFAERGAPVAVNHSVAIFASRETPQVLQRTILAAAISAKRASEASSYGSAIIDVLVNGNTALADAVAQHARASIDHTAQAPRLRIWHLALADKAHAWNQYVDAIWPESGLAFFVDGYVQLWPETIERLAQRVGSSADALGGSGVPTVGRSAPATQRAMLTEGGIHGNCFCLTQSTLLRMKQIGFRLPLGLYRGDAMIGAVLAYRLDPAQHQWDLKNVVLVEPAASWDMTGMRPWQFADWRALWKRLDRQAQGQLENLAMREHLTLRRQPPQALPATAAELVLSWAERCPDVVAQARQRNRRASRALEAFGTPRDWGAADIAPTLVADTAAA